MTNQGFISFVSVTNFGFVWAFNPRSLHPLPLLLVLPSHTYHLYPHISLPLPPSSYEYPYPTQTFPLKK